MYPRKPLILHNTGFELNDLDGNPILQKGWYDFTQRTDHNGDYIGDGARFVVDEINGIRRITKILITLTDNSFGDNNMTLGLLDDPGMPVKVTPLSSLSHDSPQDSVVTGDEISHNPIADQIVPLDVSNVNPSHPDDGDLPSPNSESIDLTLQDLGDIEGTSSSLDVTTTGGELSPNPVPQPPKVPVLHRFLRLIYHHALLITIGHLSQLNLIRITTVTLLHLVLPLLIPRMLLNLMLMNQLNSFLLIRPSIGILFQDL